MLKTIKISTTKRNQLIDITGKIVDIVGESGVRDGLCIVFCPHTTAGITINENADPDVDADVTNILSMVSPKSDSYAHSEGNSDSHAKSSIIGASETIIIENGSLLLGTWQGIKFLEADGPRSRTIHIKIIRNS